MAAESPGVLAIVGAAGAIGHSVASELTRRGLNFRVVGRDRTKLEAAFSGRAEITDADIGDLSRAQRALSDVDTVVYAVGLPYPQHDLHPVLMRSTIEAPRRAGVSRMAVVSSVYGYGLPRSNRVAETHPREPHTRKAAFGRNRRTLRLRHTVLLA